MKIFKSLIVSGLLLFPSCNLNLTKPKENTNEISPKCETQNYAWAIEPEGKLFTCQFNEFHISAYKVPAMENKEYMIKVYKWFMKSAFYGPEIHTFQGILFNGETSKPYSFGSYNPRYKLIEIYPNNTYTTANFPVPKEYAKRMGVNNIDPKSDYRYWLYTISHEYNHHSTVAMSTQKLITHNFGGNEVHDIVINKKGKRFLKHYGINKRPEYYDYNKVQPIPPGSGGNKRFFWPKKYYGTSFNKYLWTKPELLTRALGLYTYPVPKELQNEKSVNAYGGISEDYWWFANYGLNIYETYKDKDGKPVQKPTDNALKKWAEFIDNEWYNDDAKFGEIFVTHDGKIVISHNSKTSKIHLINIDDLSDTITFDKISKKDNLNYYWRPFDSRKKRQISLESKVAKSTNKINVDSTYKLFYGKYHLTEAFDLVEGQSKIMLWSEDTNIRVYKKNGLIYISTKKA